MGGMYAMKSRGVAGRFDEAVAFYGMVRVPEAWQGPGQTDAIDSVHRRGDTEVLASSALQDP